RIGDHVPTVFIRGSTSLSRHVIAHIASLRSNERVRRGSATVISSGAARGLGAACPSLELRALECRRRVTQWLAGTRPNEPVYRRVGGSEANAPQQASQGGNGHYPGDCDYQQS